MHIQYKSTRLEKLCKQEKYAQKVLGKVNGFKLQQRHTEFVAAASLAIIRKLPGPRLHQLSNDKKGLYAVDLEHPFRLLLEPSNDPIPRKIDGGIDEQSVTSVRLLKVVDYHEK